MGNRFAFLVLCLAAVSFTAHGKSVARVSRSSIKFKSMAPRFDDDTEWSGSGPNDDTDDTEWRGSGPNDDTDDTEWRGSGPNDDTDDTEWRGSGPNDDTDDTEWRGSGPNDDTGDTEWRGSGPNDDTDDTEWSGSGPNDDTDDTESSGSGPNDDTDDTEWRGSGPNEYTDSIESGCGDVIESSGSVSGDDPFRDLRQSEVFAGKLYLASVYNERLSLSQASCKCEQWHGTLLNFNSVEEFKFVYAFLESSPGLGNRFITGARRRVGRYADYVTGNILPQYLDLDWAGNYENSGDCVVIDLTHTALDHAPCEEESWYVCEIPALFRNVRISGVFLGKVYLASMNQEKLSIRKASSICERWHGSLLNLDSIEEFDFVFGFLKSSHGVGTHYRTSALRKVTYVDSITGDALPKYLELPWVREQDYCVEIDLTRAALRNAPCDAESWYVCEVLASDFDSMAL